MPYVRFGGEIVMMPDDVVAHGGFNGARRNPGERVTRSRNNNNNNNNNSRNRSRSRRDRRNNRYHRNRVTQNNNNLMNNEQQENVNAGEAANLANLDPDLFSANASQDVGRNPTPPAEAIPPFDVNQPSTSAAEPMDVAETAVNDSMVGEATECGICYEPCTAVGDHRLATTKCGHIYGKKCLLHWIQGSKVCPSCKQRNRPGDVISLFARSVKGLDDTEIKQLRSDLVSKQNEVDQCQTRIVRLQTQLRAEEEHVKVLQYQLKQAQENGSKPSTNHSVLSHKRREIHPHLLARCQILRPGTQVTAPENTCRLLACDFKQNTPMIACPVMTGATPFASMKYGVQKILVTPSSTRLDRILPLHAEAVVDLSFSPQHDGALLCVSEQKTATISSLQNNAVMTSLTFDTKPSACAYQCTSFAAPPLALVGFANGALQLYDSRAAAQPLAAMHDRAAAPTRVIAARWMDDPFGDGSASGILSLHLNRVVFWHHRDGTFTPTVLPVFGALTSGAICTPNTFLASLRPNAERPRVTHGVFTLSKSANNEFAASTVSCYEGGSRASRMCRNDLANASIGDLALATVYDEQSTSVKLLDPNNAAKPLGFISCNNADYVFATSIDELAQKQTVTLLKSNAVHLYDLREQT